MISLILTSLQDRKERFGKSGKSQMKVDTRVDGPWDDKHNGDDDIEVVMTIW